MKTNDNSRDTSVPTLLMVSLGGVLVAVLGIAALGQRSTTLMLIAAFIVLLTGTVIVTRTIGRQLDDSDGTASPRPERRVQDVGREQARERERRVHSGV